MFVSVPFQASPLSKRRGFYFSSSHIPGEGSSWTRRRWQLTNHEPRAQRCRSEGKDTQWPLGTQPRPQTLLHQIEANKTSCFGGKWEESGTFFQSISFLFFFLTWKRLQVRGNHTRKSGRTFYVQRTSESEELTLRRAANGA